MSAVVTNDREVKICSENENEDVSLASKSQMEVNWMLVHSWGWGSLPMISTSCEQVNSYIYDIDKLIALAWSHHLLVLGAILNLSTDKMIPGVKEMQVPPERKSLFIVFDEISQTKPHGLLYNTFNNVRVLSLEPSFLGLPFPLHRPPFFNAPMSKCICL